MPQNVPCTWNRSERLLLLLAVVVRRDGHGGNGAIVEHDALNGFRCFGERDGPRQQEEETNL